MVSGRTVQARAKLYADKRLTAAENEGWTGIGHQGYFYWYHIYSRFIDKAGFKFNQGRVVRK